MKSVILSIFLFFGFAIADVQQTCERFNAHTTFPIGPHTVSILGTGSGEYFWFVTYIDSTDVLIYETPEADSTQGPVTTVLSVFAVETSKGYQCFLDEVSSEGL